jgi:hypothetical protein
VDAENDKKSYPPGLVRPLQQRAHLVNSQNRRRDAAQPGYQQFPQELLTLRTLKNTFLPNNK